MTHRGRCRAARARPRRLGARRHNGLTCTGAGTLRAATDVIVAASSTNPTRAGLDLAAARANAALGVVLTRFRRLFGQPEAADGVRLPLGLRDGGPRPPSWCPGGPPMPDWMHRNETAESPVNP